MAQVALIGHLKPKTPKARVQISKTLSDRAVANSWFAVSSLPAWLTEEFYDREIQPQLGKNKVREVAEVMQVSLPYAAHIRSGRRRPHPRHWRALARLTNITVPE